MPHISLLRSLTAVAAVSGLLAACEDEGPNAPLPPEAVAVLPSAETAAVADDDDAADDPAIWVNPTDPSASLIVGTNKRRGLVVYDLEGRIVFENTDGRMNNVDIRTVPIGGEEQVVVAATNRTDKTISVYALDPSTGGLTDLLAEPVPSGFDDPYGLCLYRSAESGNLYVYAGDTEGAYGQWLLYDDGLGKLRGTPQRIFQVGSQTEGCVADEENGVIFIGEENVGIWKYGAEPKDSLAERALVDGTENGPNGPGKLIADVEGLSLYIPADGGGYLVASSQGNYTYVLYERVAPHAYVGTIHIADDPAAGIDGAEETDGLDVTALPVGPAYPAGLLVVQDGFNKNPDGSAANQNFKLVSWEKVKEALELP